MPKPTSPSGASTQEKLKIGLVLDDSLDSTDGVQQYVLTLGAWLSRQGHDVHYLVGETVRHDIANLHSLSRNIKVKFNGNTMRMPLPARKRRLKQLLLTEVFDVLHIQTPYSPFLAGRLIRLCEPRTNIVGTFHILPYSRLVSAANRLLALWCWRSLRRFQIMLCVSCAAEKFARRIYGLHSSAVVPNVFDRQRFAIQPPNKPNQSNPKTILFMGRLVERKGCATLLNAVYLLRTKYNGAADFRVVICGKGPLQAQLEAYCREHKLADIVTFAGFIDEADKPDMLARADISVFPSRGGESFGIVLLEAMASGAAAVLAGDNPGYRSVMAPQSDLLFDPTSAKELADKLASLLRDETKRVQAAAWGADHVRQFDVAVVGPSIVTAYRNTLPVTRSVS